MITTTPTSPGPPVKPLSPQVKWENVCYILEKEFYRPDLEALMISICAACSHYYLQEHPVWLQILGPSGSGKTALIIEALKALPLAQVVGDMTPRAFLPGKEKVQSSLLPREGGTAIWLAKDMTTIYSMRYDDRKEVAARLREVWDGEIWRDTGMGKKLHWFGKVTMIGVATPDVEDAWGVLRGMGERFLTLRLRVPVELEERIKIMQSARRQVGRLNDIGKEIRRTITELTDLKLFENAIPPTDLAMRPLDLMSEMAAQLRTNVKRETDWRRSILGVDTPESPTRISAGLAQIVRTHQAMFPGNPLADSMSLAQRVVQDLVPPTRRKVLHFIPREGIDCGDLYREVNDVPITTFRRTVEDLIVLGVLEPPLEKEWQDNLAVLTPKWEGMVREAGMEW